MSDNYYFQNRSLIGGPINMKKVVLDILRNYGIFIHMRDEPRDKYDIKDFLHETNPMGIPYHLENIERAKNKIKECKDYLKKIESDSDALYQKYYDDGLTEYTKLIESNKYYHYYQQRATDFNNTIKVVENFLNDFNIDGQSNLTNIVKENLTDCLEALKRDEQNAIDAAEQNDVNKHTISYTPVNKKEWLQVEIIKCKNAIELNEKRIKEEEEIIKRLKEKDKVIKTIFAALEPYDVEE